MRDVLSMVLILDQRFFYRFLDWAKEVYLEKEVLFLIENSSLHFPPDDGSTFTDTQIYWKLCRVVSEGSILESIIPDFILAKLRKLVAHRIPLQAALASSANVVWKRIFDVTSSSLPDSQSCWPSLRRALVENHGPFDFVNDIVGTPRRRSHFERYLKYGSASSGTRKHDANCLYCWEFIEGFIEDLRSRRQYYRDIFGVFRYALLKARELDRNHVAWTRVDDRSPNFSSSRSSSPSVKSQVSLMSTGEINTGYCAIIPASVRLDFSSLLDTICGLDLDDADSLDESFVINFLHKLDKSLAAMLHETRQYLEKRMVKFTLSTEYARMIAEDAAQASPEVQRYLTLIKFLETRGSSAGIIDCSSWHLGFSSHLFGLFSRPQFLPHITSMSPVHATMVDEVAGADTRERRTTPLPPPQQARGCVLVKYYKLHMSEGRISIFTSSDGDVKRPYEKLTDIYASEPPLLLHDKKNCDGHNSHQLPLSLASTVLRLTPNLLCTILLVLLTSSSVILVSRDETVLREAFQTLEVIALPFNLSAALRVQIIVSREDYAKHLEGMDQLPAELGYSLPRTSVCEDPSGTTTESQSSFTGSLLLGVRADIFFSESGSSQHPRKSVFRQDVLIVDADTSKIIVGSPSAPSLEHPESSDTRACSRVNTSVVLARVLASCVSGSPLLPSTRPLPPVSPSSLPLTSPRPSDNRHHGIVGDTPNAASPGDSEKQAVPDRVGSLNTLLRRLSDTATVHYAEASARMDSIKITRLNSLVALAFRRFFTDLFLYALPACIVHYPTPHCIVGCDVDRLVAALGLQHAVERRRAAMADDVLSQQRRERASSSSPSSAHTTERQDTSEAIRNTNTGSSQATSASSPLYPRTLHHMRGGTANELLPEDIGINYLLEDFCIELLLSHVFVDLIARHGPILDTHEF